MTLQRCIKFALALQFLTAAALAEATLIVAPSGLEPVEGDSQVGIGVNEVGQPLRFQALYLSDNFASLPAGKRILTGWAVRLDGSSGTPNTIGYGDLDIRVSTTSVDSLSTTYADNVGANETVVLKTVGVSLLNQPVVGAPRDFGEPFVFDTPFEYDPNDGNLLLDIRIAGGIDRVTSVDAQSTPGPSLAIGGLGDLDAAVAQFADLDLGVRQFVFTPEPSTAAIAICGVLCVAGLFRQRGRTQA
jgi:hypothetical protein